MRMNKKTTLYNFLSDSNKIIIPDIQRDYVLGSGKRKIISLFANMIEAVNKSEDFEFSCILAYKDSANNVYIYDGQQRLATLIYLCAKLCEKKEGNKIFAIKNLLQKFEFQGRELAIEWLKNTERIQRQEAVDFTTLSIAELFENFEEKIKIDYSLYTPREFITLDFLLHKIKFDLIFINEISDAEQFFMDVNDGLDLKDYEIYKAELYHHVKAILGMNKFKVFALKMENEWLEFFLKFRQENSSSSEEEMLTYFFKFCFRMMWIEENGTDKKYEEKSFDWIETWHIKRIEKIIDNIIKLEIDNNDVTCINYSFGKRTDRKWNENVSKVEGVFWNLNDNNYTTMLTTFLKHFYIEKNKRSVNKDAVIWAYISNCQKDVETLLHYLRFIKKLLNYNLVPNSKAFFDKERMIWYTKNSVYGIPNYYSEIGDFSNLENEDYTNYIYSIIQLNKSFDDKMDYSIFNTENERLNKILGDERMKNLSNQQEDIIRFENLPFVNGLVDNLLDERCDLIIGYKQFMSKLGIEENPLHFTYKDINKILGKIFFECSNIENSYNTFLTKDLEIKWIAYTGNFSSASGNLLPKTLTDFFSDKGLKQITGKWIKDEETLNLNIDEETLYMKLYRYITPKGWSDSKHKIIYPAAFFSGQYDTYRGLCSSEGKIPPVRNNISDFFDTLILDEKRKLIFNNGGNPSIADTLSNNETWITEKLKEYQEPIFYCKDFWRYQHVLDAYIQDENKYKEIKNCWNDKKEKEIGIIWNFFEKIFFIPNEALEKYFNEHN